LFSLFPVSVLEKRVENIEGKRNSELENLKEEKEQLKNLVEKQTNIMKEMEQQLIHTSSDNSVMKQQQQELTNTVNNLIHKISVGKFPSACISISTVIAHGTWGKINTHSNIMPAHQQLFKCLGKS